MIYLVGLVFFVAVFFFVRTLSRANELAFMIIRQGKITVKRGKPPRALIDGLEDITEKDPIVKTAQLRIVVEEQRPRVIIEGDMAEFTAQRIRNVVGLFPRAKWPRS